VCFDQVEFSYGDTAPVLRGASFALRAGEQVALVGPSGGGKSTIARLLLGLLTPNRGRILIDGRPLSEWDRADYRRQLGAVLQEGVLLQGSIAENITLGDPVPDRTRLEEVGAITGVDAIVASWPQGYDSSIAERGTSLSGGQRQRIALARVLYRRPRLAILDEASSALDPSAACELRRRLRGALPDCTMLVIAHDPEAARDADRILRLDQGRIVEDAVRAEGDDASAAPALSHPGAVFASGGTR
jgi:ABC-type multidrug transport system fused ATPase/permease subunit